MATNRDNFTIRGRTQNLPDPQKSWLWQVTILNLNAIVPNVLTNYGAPDATVVVDSDDLTIRCRGVSLPPRDNEAITSNFMSTKQHFFGRPTVDGTMQCQFEETNDQKVRQIFHAWNQKIVNVDPAGQPNPVGVGGAGQSVALRNQQLKADIFIEMFNYNGDPLKHAIVLFGAWPKTIGEVSLTYTESSIVTLPITFQYDYHLLSMDNIIW